MWINKKILQEIGGNILRNNKITINAAGMVNGMRKMRDGVAFFGKQLKNVNFFS